jgi:hypothetical protein
VQDNKQEPRRKHFISYTVISTSALSNSAYLGFFLLAIPGRLLQVTVAWYGMTNTAPSLASDTLATRKIRTTKEDNFTADKLDTKIVQSTPETESC